MYQYEIKIPKERIAVLIGTKGKIKREIESATKSGLKIDSKEGDVFIHGKDSIGLITAKEIIHAIGRGFNPDIALALLKPDYCIEMIDIGDYARNTKKDMISASPTNIPAKTAYDIPLFEISIELLVILRKSKTLAPSRVATNCRMTAPAIWFMCPEETFIKKL